MKNCYHWSFLKQKENILFYKNIFRFNFNSSQIPIFKPFNYEIQWVALKKSEKRGEIGDLFF